MCYYNSRENNSGLEYHKRQNYGNKETGKNSKVIAERP